MVYCTMRPVSQVPWLPAGRCGFNRILGICPTHPLSGGSVLTERNVTLYTKFSRKSGDDIPVRVRPAIVRIQNPEASIRAIVQIAKRKPQRKTARLALQVRYSIIRGKPLCQATACHSPLVPFGETPETIYQYAFDQPKSAARNQRPAVAPLVKLPSARHSLCPDVPASV